MSADFWAGYISGAAGILVGNPLDLIKTRLQAGGPAEVIPRGTQVREWRGTFDRAGTLVRGVTAPILGYGALNALLFMTYNRTLSLITNSSSSHPLAQNAYVQPTYSQIYLAGFLGGLATFVVSAPTELIKVRAQVASSSNPSSFPTSTWQITKQVFAAEGIKGLYRGGVVTAARDAIGYGFYFVAYDVAKSAMGGRRTVLGAEDGNEGESLAAWKILLCGGLAGIVTWTSIFPLDVIKTKVQTQLVASPTVDGERSLLLNGIGSAGQRPVVHGIGKGPSTLEVARVAYNEGGMSIFFRGLGVCNVRAFIVNAVQWAVYEWIMGYMLHQPKVKAMAVDI